MSQKYCYQVGEWVEDNVSQQVQHCVEQHCKWWCACCNKWLCGLIWIVVTITKWVLVTVCEILGDTFDFLVDLLKGGWDILAGLFTGDWGRVWAGFLEILGGASGLFGDLLRAVTGCGLVGAFRESINKWRLRGYVEDLIDNSNRFSESDRAQIKDALGINGDGFGLRLNVTSYRGFVRSDYVIPGDTVPALVRWNNDPDPNTRVDLKILAGFDWTSFSELGRPDVRGDGSESDLEDYLANPGSKSFSIYAVSDAELLDRIHNIQIKGDTIGLKLVVQLTDSQLVQQAQVRPPISDPDGPHNSTAVVNLLATNPFNRPPVDTSPDKANAASVLCTPVVLGTFMYQANHFNGYSACLFQSTCLEGGGAIGNNGGTGAVYRQRVPNFASTWAPIHELGHTFGLCHVTGLDRIMVSTNKDNFWWWWSWSFLPEYICFSGEPQFVYDEAKKVWDYIIAHFPPDCLANRQPIVII